MRSFYSIIAIVIAMAAFHPHARGQAQYQIGNSKDILKSMIEDISKAKGLKKKLKISLQVSKDKILNAEVNYHKFSGDSLYIIGKIENYQTSDFFLVIAKSYMKGNIVIKEINKAYTYYADATGGTFVREDDVNDIVCINYGKAPAENSGSPGNSSTLNAPIDVSNLQSFEGATGCVLLDFNGHNVTGTPWNGGNPINAEPSGMTPEAILESWEIVSEDFRPFNLNITTSETVFNSYAKNRRMRCIITPTNTAAPGSGGVAYINSFTWNNDTPCWVFTLTAKASGEASSHEIGHTLNLGHDGRTTPAEDYYLGQGNWATIMGASYYKSITQWSKGEYANSNNKEDDLAKIASSSNGFGYRSDDHGKDPGSASNITIDGSGTILSGNKGIIETTTDVDFFKFTTSGGSVVLNVNPAVRHGNLNTLTKLYNSSGTLLLTNNPSGLASSINTTLPAGTYYLSVDGTGEGDPLTTGYSEYASIGSYSITGTIPTSINSNQLPVVSISSPSAGMQFIAPANINITATASDMDGTITKIEFYSGATKLGEDANAPYTFSWSAVAAGSYVITAKATDNSGGYSTSANVTFQVVSSAVAPIVNLTSPINGSTFITPANINISANASDGDGTISKVEFFSGTSKIGEDLIAPFSFSWNNVSPGTYTLTAVATDNTGLKTTSSSSVITVTSPEVSYCTSKGNSSSYEFINFVGIGAINNTSGNNGGYRDFTSLSTPLSKNTSISISFSAGFRGAAYREYWYVWIDYNKDGSFTDNERVVYGTSTGTSVHTSTFNIPSTAISGKTRMRISMKYQASNTSCGNFTYGEVEDYSIVINEAAAISEINTIVEGQPLSLDNDTNVNLIAFPSPATNTITISNMHTSDGYGQILDMHGNELKKFSIFRTDIEIDIADLPAGVYLIRINSERDNQLKKFVKI